MFRGESQRIIVFVRSPGRVKGTARLTVYIRCIICGAAVVLFTHTFSAFPIRIL